MATVTAGNTTSFTIQGDQTVSITTPHNTSGRYKFAPSNSVKGSSDVGLGQEFGPLPVSLTIGPFAEPGTFSITSDVGTVTYTTSTPSYSGNLTAVSLAASFTDASGTPGAATINTPRGRVALAAGASTITVTNSLVTATSSVFGQLLATDGLATAIQKIVPGSGSFVITFNGASVGTAAQADFLVVN